MNGVPQAVRPMRVTGAVVRQTISRGGETVSFETCRANPARESVRGGI